MKRTGVIIMSILSIISLLTGCGKTTGNERTHTVELAQGAELTGLYMSHQSMAMQPYYMLRVTPDGNFMKITNIRPGEAEVDYVCPDTAENLDAEVEKRYFGGAGEVYDCEHASVVEADSDIVKKLNDAVIEAGALNWDGYTRHVSMDGVLDAGDSYSLFLLFSDGSTVTVESYNSRPEGWDEMFVNVREIFEANADFSRYRIQEFSEEKCARMIVGFFDGNLNPVNEFKIDINVRRDLGTWSWSVKIKDSDGLYLEKGTEINEYREENIDALSLGRLAEVLNAGNVREWDGLSGTVQGENRYMTILVSDEDGKTVNASGNVIPENYDMVRDGFIKALIEFYGERKQN